MSENVIEERGDYRVRVEYDSDSADEFPDWIQSAVIPMSDRSLSYNDDYGYTDLIRGKWSHRRSEVIDRWLRIFHDVRAVTQVSLRAGDYLVLLTEVARKYYGTPDDHLQECVDGDAEAFRQWAEGEVYGYVIEERASWRRVGGDPGDTMDTWEIVDSLWGLYGSEYAEQEAREALSAMVTS